VPRTRHWSAARLALALSLLLSLLAGIAGSPPAAEAGPLIYRLPSWWSGVCDAPHWNAVARADGWRGAGAHPLGATYKGIPVCGPSPATAGGVPNVLWRRPGWGYPEWQCTELAFRFMAQIYGVRAYAAAGGTVVSLYRSTYGGRLLRYRNGTVGHAPQRGDIISFVDNSSAAARIYGGHATVVAASNVNRYGNGVLLLMSQDDTATGWRSIAVRNWRVYGIGRLPAYGWLHDPYGRGY
jgi:hypothetical protein